MTVRAKLKDLAPGTVFNAGPIDVRVLIHQADLPSEMPDSLKGGRNNG